MWVLLSDNNRELSVQQSVCFYFQLSKVYPESAARMETPGMSLVIQRLTRSSLMQLKFLLPNSQYKEASFITLSLSRAASFFHQLKQSFIPQVCTHKPYQSALVTLSVVESQKSLKWYCRACCRSLLQHCFQLLNLRSHS